MGFKGDLDVSELKILLFFSYCGVERAESSEYVCPLPQLLILLRVSLVFAGVRVGKSEHTYILKLPLGNSDIPCIPNLLRNIALNADYLKKCHNFSKLF